MKYPMQNKSLHFDFVVISITKPNFKRRNTMQATQEQRDNARIKFKLDRDEFVKAGGRIGRYLALIPTRYQPLFLGLYKKEKSYAKGVKAKCLDCSVFQKEEVTYCQAVTCPLWHIRPYTTTEISEKIWNEQVRK